MSTFTLNRSKIKQNKKSWYFGPVIDLPYQKIDGGIVYKQVLINAKLKL
jgi:hypothetical protein